MATVTFGDFEWDDRKAAANVVKHGVSFEEASTVFLDLDYLLLPDATGADRFLALGWSCEARLLIVVHLERSLRVRILSARRATTNERREYERRKNDA